MTPDERAAEIVYAWDQNGLSPEVARQVIANHIRKAVEEAIVALKSELEEKDKSGG